MTGARGKRGGAGDGRSRQAARVCWPRISRPTWVAHNELVGTAADHAGEIGGVSFRVRPVDLDKDVVMGAAFGLKAKARCALSAGPQAATDSAGVACEDLVVFSVMLFQMLTPSTGSGPVLSTETPASEAKVGYLWGWG